MGHTSEWIRESLRSAFLTSTEEMLKPLLDPYLENYCSEGSKTLGHTGGCPLAQASWVGDPRGRGDGEKSGDLESYVGVGQ